MTPSRNLCRGEAKDSALLSSRDAGLLEPPERPQGSPASSSVWRDVHGIFQSRTLEWVAIPFSRGSSQPRDRPQVSCIAGELEPCLLYPLVWPGGLRWCLEPLGRPWSVGPWVSLGAEPLALVVRSGPRPFILQPLAHSAILPPPWSFLSGMCSGQVPPSICASPLQGHPGDSKFFPYHTGSEGSSGKLNASPSTV